MAVVKARKWAKTGVNKYSITGREPAGIETKSSNFSTFRFSVAPMMDWTDRHCRFFHRTLSRRARLYTEMLAARAVLRGEHDRLLRFDAAEHPVALQLGGSDPAELAAAGRVWGGFGFYGINIHVWG